MQIIVPPSREVQDEATRRAHAIADGLFAHQVEGVAFLLGRRRAILADDMGLGKTRQSVVALTEAAPTGPYLVICPASIKRNWQREIAAARPGSATTIVGPGPVPDAGFAGWVIVNYDILGKTIDALLRHHWRGIVFDEAHYLKNHTSQRSRLGRRLAEDAGPDVFVHLLTGTPLTNRPRDLFPLLQLSRHPMARSFLSFAKRYCAAVHNGYGWDTNGASNLDELRVQLHGLMLRRTKDDVLDLPPKLRTWLPVDVPEGTARRESRKVLELLIGGVAGAEAAVPRRGARVALLGELAKGRRKLAVAKVKHTIDLIQNTLDQGGKVLVFSCFAGPIEIIGRHFGAAALLLTGETPANQRPEIVDAFQHNDEVRVLAANIIAGGVGLNLTAARQVVFNDLDWVPANHWQAEDRAYRIGQTGTVNVSYMVGANTIDEFVARVLESKASLVEAVVEGGEMGVDVLSALETLVSSFSPRLTGAPASAAEDPVDRLLRKVSQGFEQKSLIAAQARTRSGLAADAIARLAEVLAGAPSARYRVRSSKRADVSYTLEVDGPDVTCDCPGFEYRGNCTHARMLKAALKSGHNPPEQFQLVRS